MSGKQVKLLRSQIRNVVQEILPEIMGGDLFKELQKNNNQRLDLISVEIRDTLAKMDERSKAVQDLIVRTVNSAPVEVTAKEPANETKV